MNYLFLFSLLISSELPFCIHCTINDVVEISNEYYDYKIYHIIESNHEIELRDYNNYNKLIQKFEIINSLEDILRTVVNILSNNQYENKVIFLLEDLITKKDYEPNNVINIMRYINFLSYKSLRRCMGFLNETIDTKDLINFINFVRLLDFFWNIEQSDYLGLVNDLTKKYEGYEQFALWIEKNCTEEKILKFFKQTLITNNGYLYFNQSFEEINLKACLIDIFNSDLKDADKCIKITESLFKSSIMDNCFKFNINIFNKIIFSTNTHLINYFIRKKQLDKILVKIKNQRIYLELMCRENDKNYFVEVLTGFCNLNSDKDMKFIYDLISKYENHNNITKKLNDVSFYYIKEEDKDYINNFVEFLGSMKIFEFKNFYEFLIELIFKIKKNILLSFLRENMTDIILKNILSNINNINIFEIRENNNGNVNFNDLDIENIIFVILKKCQYLKETKYFKYLICWIYYTILNDEKYIRILKFYNDSEIDDFRTYFQQSSQTPCTKFNFNDYQENLIYNVRTYLHLSTDYTIN